jgi:hypothetical protein
VPENIIGCAAYIQGSDERIPTAATVAFTKISMG